MLKQLCSILDLGKEWLSLTPGDLPIFQKIQRNVAANIKSGLNPILLRKD